VNDFLSASMWLAVFEIFSKGSTTTTARTIEALRKRRMIENGAGGRWQLSAHGRRMVEKVLTFDVS
jgi:hypothetical protein